MQTPNAYSKWSYVPNELLTAAPSPEDALEFEEIYAAILAQKDRASKLAPSAVGDFLAWNTSGTNPPVFWCFNTWAPPYLLARHLNKNQPLYAMCSFNGATNNWRLKTKYTELLAKRYIESFKQVKGVSNFVIGGNCQGAPIAESMAIQLMKSAGHSPYLLSVDYIGKRAYRGKRLMLFGRDSSFNPFLTERNPIAFWEERQAQFSWDFLEGEHGSYFLEPNVQILASFIEEKSREMANSSNNRFKSFLKKTLRQVPAS